MGDLAGSDAGPMGSEIQRWRLKTGVRPDLADPANVVRFHNHDNVFGRWICCNANT